MDISKIENKLLQFLSRDFKENQTARDRYQEDDQPRVSVPVPIPETSSSKHPQNENNTIKALMSVHEVETPAFENELLRREVALNKP